MTGYTYQTLKRAQTLRRDMTEAEKCLWGMLRGRRLMGAKFRRQQPIGPFIADFVCQEIRLIVEADGSQHAESTSDVDRTKYLESIGYRVLRFWNNDILTNPSGVFDVIASAMTTPPPPTAARRAPPSPARGEGFGDLHV